MQGDLKAAQQEIVTKVIATWRQKWTNVFSPNSLNAWNRWVKSRVASAHPQANSRWMRSRSNKYAPKPNCPNQKFADVIDAQVSTLRNWEHGRRAPTGPAKALLRAIDRDPKNVLSALAKRGYIGLQCRSPYAPTDDIQGSRLAPVLLRLFLFFKSVTENRKCGARYLEGPVLVSLGHVG